MESKKKDYSCNGFRSKAEWNVHSWVQQDKSLKDMFLSYARSYGMERAILAILNDLHDSGTFRTPDGFKFTSSAIRQSLRRMRDVIHSNQRSS